VSVVKGAGVGGRGPGSGMALVVVGRLEGGSVARQCRGAGARRTMGRIAAGIMLTWGRWGVVGGARRRPAAGPIWWRWRNEVINLCGVHYAARSEERSKRAATKFLKASVSPIHSLVS
jgi:hypothetical protein